MLDTDVCVHLIRKKSADLLRKLIGYSISDIGISSITVAELQYGVQKSSRPMQNRQALDQFLIPLSIVDFDYDAAISYGYIRAHLEAQGTMIGSLDTLIAAHALSRNVTLVTNNIGEFTRVPGLVIDDWSSSYSDNSLWHHTLVYEKFAYCQVICITRHKRDPL
ncbi:MAG TPA: type II toxin-antitoxin system VapC family toxin [Chloroflexia bacterium]|nr:type II toxin-antitoxin system VapC family toxin [Chloroflexia bacterium]